MLWLETTAFLLTVLLPISVVLCDRQSRSKVMKRQRRYRYNHKALTIFYLWLRKTSPNDRISYICNELSYRLSLRSVIERRRAFVNAMVMLPLEKITVGSPSKCNICLKIFMRPGFPWHREDEHMHTLLVEREFPPDKSIPCALNKISSAKLWLFCLDIDVLTIGFFLRMVMLYVD